MLSENEYHVIYNRINSTLLVFVLLFLFLLANLFVLQVLKGKRLYYTSRMNCTKIVYQPAPRGIIFDHLGRIVADNYPSFVLYYTPTYEDEKGDNSGKDKLVADIERIEKIINIKLDSIKRMPSRGAGLMKVVDNLSREQMFALLERGINLRNFFLEIEYKRRYRYNKIGAHILGHLGVISKEEYNLLRGNYRIDSLIGKTGVERSFDRFLRGEDGGFLVQVDVYGKQIKILDKIPPKPGNNIYLTIDWELQQFIEEEMKNLCGAVVVMDPTDGKVLALVSLPSFDPNVFVTASGDSSIRDFLNDPKHPLLNRAINGLYPPGSVYKIITAAAAIDSGKIKLERQFFCPGFFILGSSKKIFRCWKEEGHGVVSFTKGFSQSCDVYFYNLGLICGINLLEEYGKKFLVNKPLETEIGYVQPGLVPSERWKRERYRSLWFEGDTINIAIGQGYLLTTPMMLCNLACMIANRGSLYRPYFVKKIVSPSGMVIYEATPKKIYDLHLKPETYKIIIDAMERVVTQGTGQACYIPGIKVAGKTGTAQNPLGKDHALFVAFAPVDDPKIAISVVIEHGGRGGAVAAPLAKKILQKFFNVTTQMSSSTEKSSTFSSKEKVDVE